MKRYMMFLLSILAFGALASACNSSPLAPTGLSITLAANTTDKGAGGEYLVGSSFYFNWKCEGATWAQLNAPTGPSGVHSSGKSDEIRLGHPWYPAIGQTMKFSLSCGNEKKDFVSKTILVRRK